MVNPGEKMATASELLGKVLEGARFNNIQLKDVEELLANEIFTKEMLATSGQRVSCAARVPLSPRVYQLLLSFSVSHMARPFSPRKRKKGEE